ncbi:MAG: MOSC domain-containing protein [Stackebrandtia sp.]
MSRSQGEVISVNIVHAVIAGPSRMTGIDKRPVSGRVGLGRTGLAGDVQCDTRFHGGPDKALYAYACEDAYFWAAELGRSIPAGLFGENLTLRRVDVTGAVIGERWRIGDDVLVEVRMPRSPCANLAHRMGIPKFHHRFDASGRTGAYLSVLESGSIGAGDTVTVENRPGHGVTVADCTGRPRVAPMRRLLAGGTDLAEEVRSMAERILARAQKRRC